METESKPLNYAFYYGTIAILIWIAYGVAYRIYLHPLSHFPGPKLAISTYWYEFYYDVIMRGRYTWKLKELHERYGRGTPPSHRWTSHYSLIPVKVPSSESIRMSSISMIRTTTILIVQDL